ncbi:cholestenol Delta-isomerase [Marchantia polymorpha subsp. ruderalis]|uniref:EXPERA domain-containing protein n=2 Tax=Marchantia polymorpha TaxID=3197 RepID=A0A176VPM7_MARPO|nr:hypothetical protein AXG93_731s1300 [Marchantia polymorpha subsp. ruderalis]PTQ43139.1 hypothetical protein MARPO_0026s0030 [Marchantia polymorpha]BBN02179.1 hypothetical protein Mp_2g13410 [Marchantia polymorpha subsp. ruderalis]|eukprot:PTQ43139.1 hypothetical protein MARPO_0026s0030 [Marchantia polymorpha]
MEVPHPYSPASLELPGFVPLQLSREFILGVFTVFTFAVFGLGYTLSGKVKSLSKVDRLLVCWWAFTGLVHLVLEGYFVFTPDFYKLNPSNYFAEVWKEYGKGDSRYPARDSTIVLIEGITAVIEGPASLLAVYAILTSKPYAHTLQIATSLGQLYGDTLYFATVYFADTEFSAPGPIYFWGYFIFMNSIWIIVPILIAGRSWRYISKAFSAQKVNGASKKRK